MCFKIMANTVGWGDIYAVLCCNLLMMMYGLWKKVEKSDFQKKIFEGQNFNFRKKDCYIVSTGLKWSYLFSKLFWVVTLTSSSISTNFSKKCQKVNFDVRPSLDWSTVGQHLLTSKIPLLKSSKSVDYFSYIGHLHISKR